MRRSVLVVLLVSACTETETHDVACAVTGQMPATIDISEGARLEIALTCEESIAAADVSCQHVGPGDDLANNQVIYIPLEASDASGGGVVLRGDMPPRYLDITEPKTVESRIDCGLECCARDRRADRRADARACRRGYVSSDGDAGCAARHARDRSARR
jgi:hypothetical protein